mgnify:FL=1
MCNSSLTDEPKLMKLYIVVVYDLRMCIKEGNPSPNYFKADSIRYGMWYCFVI